MKTKPLAREEESKHNGMGTVASHDDNDIIIDGPTFNSDAADMQSMDFTFSVEEFEPEPASTFNSDAADVQSMDFTSSLGEIEPEPVFSALEISFDII
jgi:hypothetical protein